MFTGPPLPLRPDVPLLQLRSVISSHLNVGAWFRGSARRLLLYTRAGGRCSGVLIAADLGLLLRRCNRVVVRQGRQLVLLESELLIKWRALRVVTGAPWMPCPARLQELFPGRSFLGIGSGESLNETPAGMDWPDTGEQVRRMEEALEIIDQLLDGERLDHEGRFFRTKSAYLHTRGERRPPVYVSAFGPDAARVAARLGDGLWTLADPESAPDLIDTYRGAREDAGREPGEIILQTGFSWAEDDDAALEGARVWKATQPPEYFTDDWHDPRAMYEKAEREVSDEEFMESYIVSSDPEQHLERIREVEGLGGTVVCLQNASGSDPLGALRTYRESVLPALRGARV